MVLGRNSVRGWDGPTGMAEVQDRAAQCSAGQFTAAVLYSSYGPAPLVTRTQRSGWVSAIGQIFAGLLVCWFASPLADG